MFAGYIVFHPFAPFGLFGENIAKHCELELAKFRSDPTNKGTKTSQIIKHSMMRKRQHSLKVFIGQTLVCLQ